MNLSASLKLLAWLSPAFPTGAFAYSHGLEWAVQEGDVRDGATLRAWVEDVLRFGTGRTDAILLRMSYETPPPLAGGGWGEGWNRHPPGAAPPPPSPPARGGGQEGPFPPPLAGGDGGGVAAAYESLSALRGVSALARALAPSRERLAETLHQGNAFAAAAKPWGELPENLPYPVAVGTLAAAHGIDADTAAAALLQGFAANLISAAVRLVPLGQSTGLAVLAALEPVILAVVEETRHATLDDLGGACFRSDIAAMRHETQYTRLFRS